MENKKYLIASIFVACIIFSGAISYSFGAGSQSDPIFNEGVTFDGYVTIKHYDASEGIWTTLMNNVHNVFTEDGKNYTRVQIGEGGDTKGATYIALTNETYVPAEAHDEADWAAVELSVGNLSRAACTFANGTTKGEWNCTYTFVANETVPGVHAVASLTNSTGGDLVAETNFTAVTLEAADQIQCTWNYSVS